MAETPQREASPPPQRPFRALWGPLPTGAVLWAKMLSHSNLGRSEAAPQVALSERSRPWYGARREAAPRVL
eukprot:9638238-Alexandrium_andersonii.AAC.1